MTEEAIIIKTVIDTDFINKRPLSYSSLKQFRSSPRHYMEYLESKFKPTPAMFLGSVVDVMVLTAELFDDTYTVIKAGWKATASSTDKSKERWKETQAEAKENKKIILFDDVHNTAKRMKESLWAHPQAKEMLENKIRAQIRLTWNDTDTKLPLIGYTDFETMFLGLDTIVELKTAADADPLNWGRTVINFGYDLQGAMYLDGYHKMKYRFPEYYWLVVENKPPFAVSVNRFQKKDIEIAKEEMGNTIKAFKYCMDNNQFNRGYEFRLFDSLPYHQAELPMWRKSVYG